ncbi:MAG: hypothetical protein J0G36_22085 [Afipia sp.]|nr:hypothetical protein [Afipia sp.]
MFQAAEENITQLPLRSNHPAASVNVPPVVVMATLLRTMGTDLGDEREVIRVLIRAKFSADQVLNLMDETIALAR